MENRMNFFHLNQLTCSIDWIAGLGYGYTLYYETITSWATHGTRPSLEK